MLNRSVYNTDFPYSFIRFVSQKTISIAKCFPSLSDDVIKQKKKTPEKKRKEHENERVDDCYILAGTDINSVLFIFIRVSFFPSLFESIEMWGEWNLSRIFAGLGSYSNLFSFIYAFSNFISDFCILFCLFHHSRSLSFTYFLWTVAFHISTTCTIWTRQNLHIHRQYNRIDYTQINDEHSELCVFHCFIHISMRKYDCALGSLFLYAYA